MSDDLSTNKPPSVAKLDQEISFLVKNPLQPLQKKLKSSVLPALEQLSTLMSDVETDPKLKADIAKFLIKSYTDVTDSINKDQSNRLMLEVKTKGVARSAKNVEQEGGTSAPSAILTSTIIDIDKRDGDVDDDDEVHDMGNWDVTK